jgi:hypothetical protein
MTTEKSREARLRRMAARQGLILHKSRRRDPNAIGYGGYMLVNAEMNAVVHGELDSFNALSLDDVEAWLTRPASQRT